MSDDDILRWLIDFGTDWVVVGETLKGTWAIEEIGFTSAVVQGDLESNLNIYDGEPRKLKLSEKAIARLGDRTGI